MLFVIIIFFFFKFSSESSEMLLIQLDYTSTITTSFSSKEMYSYKAAIIRMSCHGIKVTGILA